MTAASGAAGGGPFLVLALPRSRTTWLSRFLTYGRWTCWHEQLRHLREIQDARAWLSQAYTGSAETAVARWWKLLPILRPDLRLLVIRRPVEQVLESLMRVDVGEGRAFDRGRLEAQMVKYDRALDQVERHLSPLSIPYQELEGEEACRRAFEYCLGVPHDHEWWEMLAGVNIQCDFPALVRYAAAFAPQMREAARRGLFQLRHSRQTGRPRVLSEHPDGITIQVEQWSSFLVDAEALFREHCVAVGEPEDQFLRKNHPLGRQLEKLGRWHVVTARSNGRMLGYLVSIISQSTEAVGLTIATQTLFFASQDAQRSNLPLRLQRAAIEDLRKRGIGEVYMRAGVRGGGPKLGVLYRRLGAEEFGSLYKLGLA